METGQNCLRCFSLQISDKYSSQFGVQNQFNPYGYTHEEDESSFQLVDMTKVQRPAYQRGRGRYNNVSQSQTWLWKETKIYFI